MRLLIFIVVSIAVMGLTVLYLEGRMIYYPVRQEVATPAAIGIADYQEVYFNTEDRVRLHGWFIPVPDARHTALLCHGNGGNISHRLKKIQILRELGIQIFIFDYRGYGRSNGSPSEKGLYRDALAAYDYLTKERKIPAAAIVAYGESLGGAVATHLALHRSLGALIIEESFTSAKDMARIFFPYFPSFFIRTGFDSTARIGLIKIPKLFIHSVDDELVPFKMGQALYRAAAKPKMFLKLQGGHNTAFLDSEHLYRKGVGEFLGKL